MSHSVYLFISWWIFASFLPFGYCEFCYEHLHTVFCLNNSFYSFEQIPKSETAGSYCHSLFNLLIINLFSKMYSLILWLVNLIEIIYICAGTTSHTNVLLKHIERYVSYICVYMCIYIYMSHMIGLKSMC